jgi:hypothetical protein
MEAADLAAMECIGMAWIKVRGGLVRSPEIVNMAIFLIQEEKFRLWVSPSLTEETVWDEIELPTVMLRYAVLSMCVEFWSQARDHGKFVRDDLLLPGLNVDCIDEMIDVPCFGRALQEVRWAKPTVRGVILPDFKLYNLPVTAAERQRAYREREREAENSRDDALRKPRNDRVTDQIRSELTDPDSDSDPDSDGSSLLSKKESNGFSNRERAKLRNANGIFRKIKEPELKDPVALMAWHDAAVAKRDPLVADTDASRIRVLAVMIHVRHQPKVRDPAKLFADIFGHPEKWEHAEGAEPDAKRLLASLKEKGYGNGQTSHEQPSNGRAPEGNGLPRTPPAAKP